MAAFFLTPFITLAQIAAPPQLVDKPDAATSDTQPTPAAKSSPLSEKAATFQTIPAPIEFESLDLSVEDALEMNPNRAAEAASVKSMQIEIEQALETGDTALAESLFTQLMRLGAPTAYKRDAMLQMARNFDEKQNQPTKAAIVYEQILSNFPNDPESPNIMLRLGRIYRDSGAFAAALNKFYNVLYSSLQVKTGDETGDSSLRAKMEIAHTHFAAGEYQTAAQLYSRLTLLKMSQQEASEVAFRMAYISYLSKEYANALAQSRDFLANFPASPLAPEAQYLQIQALRALGRSSEAMQETIKLLQAGREFGKKKPAVWAYWQRKTGNEIANELYESGDALGALTIYQKLAELNDAPNWRGPAVYQIGLCFERLRHMDRARQAYNYILKSIPASTGPDLDPINGSNLAHLRDMAQWRLEHLDWLEQSEKDVFPLLDKPAPIPQGQSLFQQPASNPPANQPASQALLSR